MFWFRLRYLGFMTGFIKYKVLSLIFFFCRLSWPHQTCEWAGPQWQSHGRWSRDSFNPTSSASCSNTWVSYSISHFMFIYRLSYHMYIGCYSGPVMKMYLWDKAASDFGERFKASGGTASVILVTTLNPKRYGGLYHQLFLIILRSCIGWSRNLIWLG